jgi:hypothetical protein
MKRERIGEGTFRPTCRKRSAHKENRAGKNNKEIWDVYVRSSRV